MLAASARCVRSVSLLLFMLALVIPCQAQEHKLLDLRVHGGWSTYLHGGAALYDGLSTRHFVHSGYIEVDPPARVLLGSHPGWSRMLPLGALEVWGVDRLPARWHHIPLRRSAQLACIGAHLWGGSRNWHLGRH